MFVIFGGGYDMLPNIKHVHSATRARRHFRGAVARQCATERREDTQKARGRAGKMSWRAGSPSVVQFLASHVDLRLRE